MFTSDAPIDDAISADRRNASADFRSLLIPKQRKYAREYEARWCHRFGSIAALDPRCAYNVGDNPEYRLNWSGPAGALPTFTRNACIVVVPSRGRWVLPCERAAAMGFPVFPLLASSGDVSLICDEFDERGAAGRIGNAMHVANIGTIVLVALACVNSVS